MLEQPGPSDQDWDGDDEAFTLHDLEEKLEEGLDVELRGKAVELAVQVIAQMRNGLRMSASTMSTVRVCHHPYL